MVKIELPHSIEYTMEEGLSLVEIAETLLANQVLVDRVPEVLEEIFPGLSIDSVKISLEQAETGSLHEEFIVYLYTEYQEHLEDGTIKIVEKLMGTEVPPEFRTLVSIIVILIVLYGASKLYNLYRKKDGNIPNHQPSIQGDYNTALTIVTKNLVISESDLDSAISRVVDNGNKRNLWTAIRRFIVPAKKNGGTAIRAHGEQVISADSVREFPIDTEEDSPMVPLTGVRIRILALDRQKHKTGWAANFPDGEIDRPRIRMDLFPTISLDDLSRAEIIKGDVFVEYDPEKETPKTIHLVKVDEVLS